MLQTIKSTIVYNLAIRKINRLFEKVRARQEYDYGIANSISVAWPFSAYDIWQAYKVLKSWDETICLCEYCAVYALESVYHSIGFFYQSKEGIAFRRAYKHTHSSDN
jgi:hypothetical protein